MTKPNFERRDALGGVNQDNLDPTTGAALRGLQRTDELRHMTKPQKQAKKKNDERTAKEQKRMAARNRFVIDIPPDIAGQVEEIARREGVSASGVIALACWMLLRDDRQRLVDWSQYKRPTKSPRFDWRLIPPPIPD